LHLKGLEEEQITREDGFLSWTRYVFPYRTLPKLRSHLQPKFVIFDVGRKLQLIPRALYSKITKDFPLLIEIHKVYIAWMNSPEDCENDTSYSVPGVVCEKYDFISDYNDYGNDNDDPEDLDYSDKKSLPQTEPGRLAFTRSVLQKRKRLLSEVKWINYNRQYLTEVTLRSHNRQSGEAAWTDDRIREWTKHNRQFGEAAWTDDRREWKKSIRKKRKSGFLYMY
jgi:hypothetical protein